MGLQFTDHSKRPELEQEFRSLARRIDSIEARTAAPSEPTADTPTDPVELPSDLVRSWSFRLDSNSTIEGGHVKVQHFEVAQIEAPAFTHLELFLALERCNISGLLYMFSLAPFAPIQQFNAAAGGDIPWQPPTLNPVNGAKTRGKASLYEFALPQFDGYARPVPNAPAAVWANGDTAFFPIGLAGAATGAPLLLTRTILNQGSVPQAVCLRGYLTGRYIEHAERPANTWLCSALPPAGA